MNDTVNTNEQPTTTNKWEDVALLSQDKLELLDHPDYKKLMDDFTKAEQDRDEVRNQFLLAKADIENARKRFERDLASAHKYAIDRLVLELLPVIDSLERGLEIKTTMESINAGMQLTLDLLLKALQKYGVKQVNPVGEMFNPGIHEAMSVQDAPDITPNTVLTVVQKGYLLNERVLRPALVIVSKS